MVGCEMGWVAGGGGRGGRTCGGGSSGGGGGSGTMFDPTSGFKVVDVGVVID